MFLLNLWFDGFLNLLNKSAEVLQKMLFFFEGTK